jgi:ParB-like chromosome segregation protein Spo0J
MKPKPARPESREVASLLPFPKQETYFPGLSDYDLRQLAREIDRDGLQQKIEILPRNKAGYPPNTILRGHQRLRALKLLGRETTDVLVRYDLVDATVDEIERVFLGENVNRQQLDPLSKARAALRMIEIEKGQILSDASQYERCKIRERIGKVIGMCGRNLDRYFGVLETPVPVQDAFRAGKLTLIEADKVSRLSPEVQEEIAAAIKSGLDPREVVAKHLPKKSPRHKRQHDALVAFCKNLEIAHADLADRVDSVSEHMIRKLLLTLEKGRQLIRRLLKRVEGQ